MAVDRIRIKGFIKSPKAFYVYLWLREDGSPYYVGKGKGTRATTRRGRRCFPPATIDRILLQECENEQQAFDIEKFFISYYGRLDLGTGCLRNRTSGGEGSCGHKWSEEYRDYFVRTRTGRKLKPFTDEHKKNISLAMTGKKRPHRGSPFTEERKQKIRLIMTGKSMSHKGKPWSSARRQAQINRSTHDR